MRTLQQVSGKAAFLRYLVSLLVIVVQSFVILFSTSVVLYIQNPDCWIFLFCSLQFVHYWVLLCSLKLVHCFYLSLFPLIGSLLVFDLFPSIGPLLVFGLLLVFALFPPIGPLLVFALFPLYGPCCMLFCRLTGFAHWLLFFT